MLLKADVPFALEILQRSVELVLRAVRVHSRSIPVVDVHVDDPDVVQIDCDDIVVAGQDNVVPFSCGLVGIDARRKQVVDGAAVVFDRLWTARHIIHLDLDTGLNGILDVIGTKEYAAVAALADLEFTVEDEIAKTFFCPDISAAF